jgi:transcriptional regulator with XRE-family HTH domain
MPPQTLAERLVATRERLGWSQEDAASRLGLKPPQLSKWERGVNVPGGRNLARLAKGYGVTVAELLGESTNGKAPDTGEAALDRQPALGEATITLALKDYYRALGILESEQRHLNGVSDTLRGVNESLAALRRTLDGSVAGIGDVRAKLPDSGTPLAGHRVIDPETQLIERPKPAAKKRA